MKREEWVAAKLHSMRAVAKAARRKLQEERFELEDDRVRSSSLFLADKLDLGEAMAISTKAKIHRLLHEALGAIAKGRTPDATRLATLVPMHKKQLGMLKAEGKITAQLLKDHRLFYDDMLRTIEHQILWLAHLR